MMTESRRHGRAPMTAVVAVVALGAGTAVGYFLTGYITRPAPSDVSDHTDAQAGDSGGGESWYTCGMHPNVLQEGPGDCPICQMKLTPLKKETGQEETRHRERKVLYWRAPMDPNYVSDMPGKSPMGMDLVPVFADEEDAASAHTIQIDPVTIQNMGIRSSAVTRGPLIKTIRTVGRVDYDEQLVTFIDTKFNGWIETLHADQTGQLVGRGDPLFEVYSPELYGAQVEYLAAVRSLPRLEGSTFAPAREEAVKLVEAAKTKLTYLDVSDEQIERLRETGKVEKTLTFHSPASGIVTEKMALEGMYVKPGMRLYTIADLSHVWVYVDVYEYQLPWIRVGQTATITLPYVVGQSFVGKVVYVYPYLDQQTRVIKVRLEFENPTLDLKPGMFANVTLESRIQGDALLLPREAYIDSGTRKVAFVDQGGGKFAPRDIQVGVETESGMVEVLYGLDEGEVVVTSGQFMLDGESKLKEAVAKMMEAQRATTTKRSAGDAVEAAHVPDDPTLAGDSYDSIPPDASHACPMDTHPDAEDSSQRGAYFSSQPGRCPACGMNLKPLEELDWVRVRRAAKGGDVAYTCADHQHVFSQATGECPRCGSELAPFKVMYTCPDPSHAGAISTHRGNCPRCGRGLAAFRGVWLDPAMAERNIPEDGGIAGLAAFQCAAHPLVHSGQSGNCTICGELLRSTRVTKSDQPDQRMPDGAQYTCPMKECWHFAEEPGECPVCGMNIKPIGQVAWASDMRQAEEPAAPEETYACPMHPDTARSQTRGACATCGMQLVLATTLKRPTTASGRVAAQMDYILEHYLEIQRLLASDRSSGLAINALGLVSASEELARHITATEVDASPAATAAVNQLHVAALKTTGNLEQDRVSFVELSSAVHTLVEHFRPDRDRWPKLYLYHCPMSKGDWLQTTDAKANPYYGFKMLKCGELKGVK